jgi:hypothetical protein
VEALFRGSKTALAFDEKRGMEDAEEKLEFMKKELENSKLREEELGICNKLYEEGLRNSNNLYEEDLRNPNKFHERQ